MKYLLDTNICIYIIKKKPDIVLKKLSKLDVSKIGLSSITLSELVYGVAKSEQKEKNLHALQNFTAPFEILPWTEKEAKISGEIRAFLERSGKMIGPMIYKLQVMQFLWILPLSPITKKNSHELST